MQKKGGSATIASLASYNIEEGETGTSSVGVVKAGTTYIIKVPHYGSNSLAPYKLKISYKVEL